MGFFNNTPEVMTLEQVAQYLQISYTTVYKLVRAKEIPAAKVGRSYRVQKKDVIAYLEKQKNE